MAPIISSNGWPWTRFLVLSMWCSTIAARIPTTRTRWSCWRVPRTPGKPLQTMHGPRLRSIPKAFLWGTTWALLPGVTAFTERGLLDRGQKIRRQYRWAWRTSEAPPRDLIDGQAPKHADPELTQGRHAHLYCRLIFCPLSR